MSRKLVLPSLQAQGYLRRLGRGEILSLVAFSETELMVVSRGQAAVWKVDSSPRLIHEVHGSTSAAAVRGTRVALGSRSIQIWQIPPEEQTGKWLQELEGHQGRLSALDFSPDGELLVSLGEDGLKVWAVGQDAPLRELAAEGSSLALDWARGRAAVGSTDRGAIECWDVRAGVRLPSQPGCPTGQQALGWREELLAVGVDGQLYPGGTGQDLSALAEHEHGLALGEQEGWVSWSGVRWQAHEEAVCSLAFSPSGAWLASATPRSVRIWSAPEQPLADLHEYQDWICAQALSPDGRSLALGLLSGQLRVVELLTGRSRFELEESHADAVTCVCFSGDGRWLAWGSQDCLVGLCDPRRPEPRLLDGHDAGVACLAFSPDGKLLASGSADDEVVLWDTASGMALETLHGLEAGLEQLSFSREGALAALYDDGTTVIWETSRYSL